MHGAITFKMHEIPNMPLVSAGGVTNMHLVKLLQLCTCMPIYSKEKQSILAVKWNNMD